MGTVIRYLEEATESTPGGIRLLLLLVKYVRNYLKKQTIDLLTVQAARLKSGLHRLLKPIWILAEKTHFQGKYYTATWDGETQMLSLLQSNQLKLLARWEGQQWQPLPIPLKESETAQFV